TASRSSGSSAVTTSYATREAPAPGCAEAGCAEAGGAPEMAAMEFLSRGRWRTLGTLTKSDGCTPPQKGVSVDNSPFLQRITQHWGHREQIAPPPRPNLGSDDPVELHGFLVGGH